MAPLLASDSPSGSPPPVNDQATFPTLPEVARLAEYVVPITPFGSEVVVIRRAAFTGSVKVALALFCVESLTVAVTENDPVDPGVPEIWPSVLRLSPCGSPDADQLYPPLPPDADSDCEYATPTFAGARAVVVIDNPPATVSVRVALAVFCEESLTVTVTENGPADPGVPEIWPPVLTLNPCGRPEADQLYPPLPPDAESACE